MERLRRARDLGADMGILEGVQSKDQAARVVNELSPWPMCYNSVENGVSPLISAAEAEQMGYRVIIFSFACLAPAYEAIKNYAGETQGHWLNRELCLSDGHIRGLRAWREYSN